MQRQKKQKNKIAKNERKIYMMDTSAVIDDPENIIRLCDNGANLVFINNVVYGELNNLKKTGDGNACFQSREFFRSSSRKRINIPFEEIFNGISNHRRKSISKKDSIVEFDFSFNDQTVSLYSIIRNNFRAINEKSVSMGSEINDLCISEIALDYGMILISTDNALNLYHDVSGGLSEIVKNDSFKSANEQKFMFEIKTPPKSLERDNNNKIKGDLLKAVLSVDKNFTDFTQFKFIEMAKRQESGQVIEYESGRVEFGIKVGNEIELIDFDRETGIMKDSPLSWRKREQAIYYYILTHPKNKVTAVSGSTGSGKTLVALLAGIKMVNDGTVDGIIYTRNTVTSNDKQSELGFRKGGEDTKLDPFMSPLYSAINTIVDGMKENPKTAYIANSKYQESNNHFDKQDSTTIFMKEYNIQVVDIAHLRGVSIDNKLIIVDEGQNLSSSGLKLVGTRSGQDSRFLIMGDGGQIDHPFLTEHRNSLAKMTSIATSDSFVAGVKLVHTVRSEVAEWFDKNL